jgi:hypothetical protein
LGYQEVIKLCEEALALLEGGSPIQAQRSEPSTPPVEEDFSLGGSDDSPESQPVRRFLSETDQVISETYSLMRRHEAMKDVEDMSLDALAESIHAFTSAAQERLNKH